MAKQEKKIYFGELETESYGGKDYRVWKLPSYEVSKQKAIELIENGRYGLLEEDFWILKNFKNTCQYTNLVIKHSGCQKINSHLEEEKKFNQKYCSDIKTIMMATEGNNGSVKETLVYYMEYRDERTGMMQFGEISKENLKNSYPLAMLYKRLFDRVVLDASGVGYYGIYSEDEIDSKTIEENKKVADNTSAENLVKEVKEEKPQVIETEKAKTDTVKQEKNIDLTLTDLLDYTFAGDGISMQGKTVRDCFENKPKERHAAAIAFFTKSLATVQNNDKKIVEQILNLYATHQEMFDSISYEALA